MKRTPGEKGTQNHVLPATPRLLPGREDLAELTRIHCPQGSRCVGTDAPWQGGNPELWAWGSSSLVIWLACPVIRAQLRPCSSSWSTLPQGARMLLKLSLSKAHAHTRTHAYTHTHTPHTHTP